MIRISNIKMPIDHSEEMLLNKAQNCLKGYKIGKMNIVRRSLDCRKKQDIHFVYSVDVTVDGALNSKAEEKIIKKVNNKNIMLTNPAVYNKMPVAAGVNIPFRPVIVGSGPAGYFSALLLAKNGYKPVVIERGKAVDERTSDTERFWNGGKLDKNSNVSFGEGGAGTFSDGKLATGIKDKDGRIGYILKTFADFGADEAITYDAKPHIGTDKLKIIMSNMRKAIEDNGGEIRFSTQLVDIIPFGNSDLKYDIADNEKSTIRPVYRLELKNVLTGEISYINTDALILAIGHSARDTFSMLNKRGFSMEPKPFAVGLRIEHPRSLIDNAQYGESFPKSLPAADYKLTYRAKDGRGVFSFCMCPGGYVVNASSEEGCMVVNGMSYSDRNGNNSNSAIVVSVMPSDYGSDDPLSGVEFQRKLERLFYEAGEGKIPVQRFEDFKSGNVSVNITKIKPETRGKTIYANIKSCLPPYVVDDIIDAMENFGKIIKDFDSPDAVLSGIESRTSSPVKILRDENGMSSYKGIFPAGEGAGYAGGITSAAVDGMKAAEAVAKYLIGGK